MTFVGGPVTVTVPATSANLGPGFDVLGLALDLRDTLTAEVVDGPLEVVVEGEGAGSVALDESHLVVRAMAIGFDALGVQAPSYRLECRNVVPHARGLGSSSAAIVGGLVLARALVEGGDERFDDRALLDLANALEGHPDNVAPALFGGFTVAVGVEGRVDLAVLPVAPEVSAVAFVPPDGVETKVARGLLPAAVPYADAVANTGRAALLVAALSGSPSLLMPATEDRLHQEYRRPAMPATLDLVDALRADGVSAFVSGAGPTVLALVPTSRSGEVAARVPRGWAALELAVGTAGARVER